MDIKKIIYVLAGILILSLGIVFITTLRQKEVKSMGYEAVVKKFEKGDTFLLVIGNTGCPACKDYRNGALKTYLNNKPPVDLVYVDIDALIPKEILQIEDREEMEKKKQEFYDDLFLKFKLDRSKFRYTPTTYFVKNGEPDLEDYIEGSVDYRTLRKFVDRHL